MDSPENCRKDRAFGFGFDASYLKRQRLSAGNELLCGRKVMDLFGLQYCCRASGPKIRNRSNPIAFGFDRKSN